IVPEKQKARRMSGGARSLRCADLSKRGRLSRGPAFFVGGLIVVAAIGRAERETVKHNKVRPADGRGAAADLAIDQCFPAHRSLRIICASLRRDCGQSTIRFSPGIETPPRVSA